MSCVHSSFDQNFGAPIYDEYRDDYWDGIPEETTEGLVGLGLNKERDKVYEDRNSPYILNLKASY